MTMFDVTVTRETDTWTADIAGLPGNRVHRVSHESFTALHEQIPQMIADLADVEPAKVEVDYRYEINGHDVTADVARLNEAFSELPRHAQLMREDPERTRALDDETYVKNIEMVGHRLDP